MITLAFVNNKGGVGKTSSALAVAASLARRGHRVLVLDLDAQGNLTEHAGADRENRTASVGQLLLSRTAPVAKTFARQYTTAMAPDLHLVAASLWMDDEQQQLKLEANYAYRLRDRLAPVAALYDFAVLDCPPSLEQMAYNAFVAAQWFVVVADAEPFALTGLRRVMEIASRVRAADNPALQSAGVLFTRYNPNERGRIRKEVVEATAGLYGAAAVLPPIRRDISVPEAQGYRQLLHFYAPDSRALEDYEKLTDALLLKFQPQ